MFFCILIIGDTLLKELLLPCASCDDWLLLPVTRPYSRNYLRTTKSQLCVKQNMSHKHFISHYKQQQENLCQIVSLTSFQKTNAICLNLLRGCPSVLPSVFAVLAFILIFHPICRQFPLFEF